jgi:hypothetical protein
MLILPTTQGVSVLRVQNYNYFSKYTNIYAVFLEKRRF